MANTYTQIHIQFLFAVKYRTGVIHQSWRSRLYLYIAAIVQNNGHKMLAINGMPDHVHVLVGLRPDQSISHLMQEVKANSSKWINDNKLVPGKFAWQEGYGAFSYGKSQISAVVTYIQNQEQHHQKRSFLEEYHALLKKFDIDFNPDYSFHEPID
jgi:REP element-mobilizing transposase RayT